MIKIPYSDAEQQGFYVFLVVVYSEYLRSTIVPRTYTMVLEYSEYTILRQLSDIIVAKRSHTKSRF
jgi:hypothetical protein